MSPQNKFWSTNLAQKMSKRHQRHPDPAAELQKERDNTVAFVLCHPFACTMSPINGELPPCLFPLCNSPVLLYVLNWLSVNGIEKIFVLCRDEDSQIIQKVTSQCATRMLMENIKIVPTFEPANSIGDCLRIIDQWNAQSNVFEHCIVVPGTLVTNIQLNPIIDEHIKGCNRKNSEAGLQQVMTCVFTQSNSEGYSLLEGDESLILDIKPLSEVEFNLKPQGLQINPSLMKKTKKLRVRSLLHDSLIYLCSAQVMADFKENSDWHSVCRDCVPSQIKFFNVTGHSTHMVYCGDSYAQTIDDLPNYLDTSLAVIRRWLYPMTVEMNFFAPHETSSIITQEDDFDQEEDTNQDAHTINQPISDECTAYRLKRDLVYLYDNVFPSLSAKIGHSVVIGSGTTIEDGATIINSVIGRNCVIGKNAVIENCIIWDRVTIGDSVHMDHCLVASDVQINDAITIQFGCIISFNCQVSTDLPPCRRLTVNADLLPNGFFHNPDRVSSANDIPDAKAWLKRYIRNREPLILDEEGGDEDYYATGTVEFVPCPAHELPLLKMWREQSLEFPVDDEEIILDDEYDNPDTSEEEHYDSPFNSDKEDASPDEEDENSKCMIDYNEVYVSNAIEIIKSCLERDSHNIKPIFDELSPLKNTLKASSLDVGIALIHGILAFFGLDRFQEGIELFSDRLFQFLEENEDQLDFVFYWQWYCSQDEAERTTTFVKVLQVLADEDVISEDSMDQWLEEQEDSTPAQLRLFNAYKEAADKAEEEEDN